MKADKGTSRGLPKVSRSVFYLVWYPEAHTVEEKSTYWLVVSAILSAFYLACGCWLGLMCAIPAAIIAGLVSGWAPRLCYCQRPWDYHCLWSHWNVPVWLLPDLLITIDLCNQIYWYKHLLHSKCLTWSYTIPRAWRVPQMETNSILQSSTPFPFTLTLLEVLQLACWLLYI